MRPINDYLKKLLYQYDCVVVPTLGAFLTHSVSAIFIESTGQFLPPRRKVAFNEALLLDDGILVSYLMLHENCSREEAMRAIADFVTILKQQSAQQGSFTVEGLGLFSYNREQRLQFEPELRHNFMGSAYGMQPLMVPHRQIHVAVPPRVVPLHADPKRVDLQPVYAMSTFVRSDADRVSDEPVQLPVYRQQLTRWAASAFVACSIGILSYLSIINPANSSESSLNPASLLRVPASLRSGTSIDKTVPVATSVKRKSVAITPAPTVSTLPVIAAVSAPEVKPELTTTKPVVAPVITKTPAAIRLATRTNYTVIAGSFANRRNAVRFQRTLVKAGYTDAYILKSKGLIKVAAIGTNELAEASAGITALHELTGITPWIMRN